MLTKPDVKDEIAVHYVDVVDLPEGLDVDGYCLLTPNGAGWLVDVQAAPGTEQFQLVESWHGQTLVTLDRVRAFAMDLRKATWDG